MTRWWFQIFFIFTPIWGKIPDLTNTFQRGWNHQPDDHVFCILNHITGGFWKALNLPGGPVNGEKKPVKPMDFRPFFSGPHEFPLVTIGSGAHLVMRYLPRLLNKLPAGDAIVRGGRWLWHGGYGFSRRKTKRGTAVRCCDWVCTPFFVGKRMHPSEAVSKKCVVVFFSRDICMTWSLIFVFWEGIILHMISMGCEGSSFFEATVGGLGLVYQPFTTLAVEVQWEMEVQTGHLEPQGPDLDLYFWRSTPHKTRPKLQTKERVIWVLGMMFSR